MPDDNSSGTKEVSTTTAKGNVIVLCLCKAFASEYIYIDGECMSDVL